MQEKAWENGCSPADFPEIILISVDISEKKQNEFSYTRCISNNDRIEHTNISV